MPTFQIDIQMQWASLYLTNVYHVLAADVEAAAVSMDAIAPIQAAALPSTFHIVSGRASTPAHGDGVFVTKPYNIPGSRGPLSQNLPLWNRFLISFDVGPTYQCRKFLPGVMEDDQIDGGVVTGTITYLQTNYVFPLIDLGVLCNPHGALFVSGVCKPNLAMRQLRRRKKRTTPVIPV